MGFRAAMTEGPGPNLVENPITGTSFLAEPVPEDVVRQMNKVLFRDLLEGKQWTLVSPGQARGVLASIIDGTKKWKKPRGKCCSPWEKPSKLMRFLPAAFIVGRNALAAISRRTDPPRYHLISFWYDLQTGHFVAQPF